MQRLLSITAALATALLGSLILTAPLEAGGGGHGCKPIDGTGEAVTIQGFCYQTTVLYVEPGTTVTWTNQDYDSHNVTFLDGSQVADTAFVYQGETVSHAFDEAGLFPYFCSLHPSMFGVVAVGDPASPAFGAGLLVQSPPPPTSPSVKTPATAPETVTAAQEQTSASFPSPELTAALVLGVGLVSAGGGYWLRRLRS